MPNPPPAVPKMTIESVDRAIRDWFDKTLNARVQTPNGLQKVPVHFAQGERWAIGRTKQALRDENGVLMLPVMAIKRVSVDPNREMMALGVQTRNIQIAKLVNPKTNQVRNQRHQGSVYDVYTIPFPSALVATYELVIQTQYISQMNAIIEKLWKSVDLGMQFVAPLHNDSNQVPTEDQFYHEKPLDKPYVLGFFESAATDSGNLEEFTDTERIIRYTTEFVVPFVMQTDAEGQPAQVKVERTAYKVVLKDENVHFVDDPSELDKIFGPQR